MLSTQIYNDRANDVYPLWTIRQCFLCRFMNYRIIYCYFNSQNIQEILCLRGIFPGLRSKPSLYTRLENKVTDEMGDPRVSAHLEALQRWQQPVDVAPQVEGLDTCWSSHCINCDYSVKIIASRFRGKTHLCGGRRLVTCTSPTSQVSVLRGLKVSSRSCSLRWCEMFHSRCLQSGDSLFL